MEPFANALACLWPQRIPVVDYLAGAMPADSVGAARAGRGEHIDPAQGGQLDNEPAGDSARAMNEQRFSTAKGQRLADHLLGGQRRHRKDRCGLPRNLGRFVGQRSDGCDQKRRPRTLAAQRHRVAQHLIAHTESARAITDGLDDPGSLDAERQRRPDANVPAAATNDVVPVANPGATNVDEDLVGRQRSRVVHFERLHIPAERADPRHKHGHSESTGQS